MKKSRLITIIMLLMCLKSFAQVPTFDWAKMIGLNPGVTEVSRISLDGEGGVYTCGFFEGAVDFDPGPDVYELSGGDQGFYVSKLDKNGNFVFARSFVAHSSIDGLATDSIGQMYIMGSFYDSLDADPGSGFFPLYSTEYLTPFVIKLNANGEFVWAFSIDLEPDSQVDPRTLVLDHSGNVLICGTFVGEVDFNPSSDNYILNTDSTGVSTFVCKLTSTGDFLWAKKLGSSYYLTGHLLYPIVVGKNNDIYIGGDVYMTSDFDPGAGISIVERIEEPTSFICKLDTDGVFQWVKAISNDPSYENGNLNINSMALDEADNIHVAGQFNGLVDFDPGLDTIYMFASLVTSGAGNNHQVFVLKMDQNGHFLWAKQMGAELEGDKPLGIDVDSYGNVYTVGVKTGTGDFDPGPDTYYLEDLGVGSTFISKLNRNGNFVWAGQIEQSAENYLSCGRGVQIDQYSNIHSLGVFKGPNDFDPGSGTFFMSPTGIIPYGHYTLKLKQCLLSPQLNITPPCSGDPGLLSASLLDTLPIPEYAPAEYLWSTGETTASISIPPIDSMTYTVSITDANACEYVREVEVRAGERPEALIISEGVACVGEEMLLEASGDGVYLWSTGDTSTILPIEISIDTTYYLTVTHANACTAVDSIEIAVLEASDFEGLKDTLLCPGKPVTLSVRGGVDYVWSTGETNSDIVISTFENSVYSVTVTDTYGCTASGKMSVVVGDENCPPCATIPNAFTPNGDGINDLFHVLAAEDIEVMDFRIYNRWGNLVHNNVQSWDGTWKGEPQPMEVYIYFVEVKSYCGVQELRGEVTLIR